ncbi:GNAT family N-acetyltransferase [Paenibacillus thermotolerans]|uniref:GNAT family N-acetyltransferase n=1 Tax=Paenibacillus thermotolerans TaxID=3027807 RepID=UPI0023676E0B|nr:MULTISPECIES: GNAT family N-acetyltransferase [unclassified Paenibacillus]
MKYSGMDISFRVHTTSDTQRIVEMINRDPFHMMNGVTVAQFERDLDEPGEKIRENTFVVEIEQTTVGYFSLCFVEQDTHISVYSYGTVDADRRRRGIGTAIFKFIFMRLEGIVRREGKPIHFIHRALTCIPGETNLGFNFGMQEQNILEILSLKIMTDMNNFYQPSGFNFRAPTLGDAKVWADIYNDAFGGNKSTENVIHEFDGPNFCSNLYIICVSEFGFPIGTISSYLRGTHARIPTIAVRRDWQGKGIGKALLSEILNRLKILGADDVRLSVDSKNSVAKSLYHKFGLQEEYKRIHYITKFLP